MSDELCGRCKKPIQPGDVREYYGWYMTHRPTECVRLLESEVSRLLERIDALCEESVSFSTQCDDLRAQCDDLRAENEALRQDAERLDWLEKVASLDKVELAKSLLHTGFEIGEWPSMRVTMRKGTLRDAIDAAMKEQNNES